VKIVDGTIGIFDTKSRFTASDKNAKQKADALQEYIRKHRDLKLWGGLVVPDGKNGWKIQADAITHEMANGNSLPVPYDYSESKYINFEL